MLNFLTRLPAYPNVRTEPQSDIGRNGGKKKKQGLKPGPQHSKAGAF